MGTLASGVWDSDSGAKNLPELATWATLPFATCSLASNKVKASFKAQLWKTPGQIPGSLADALLRNNPIFLYLPLWQLQKEYTALK